MQTFLPYASFAKSARVLDYRRLGKQRIEAKQIYLALTKRKYGWKNHPAVKMWQGYETALCEYGRIICMEWIRRGYNDSQLSFFEKRTSKKIELPRWFGSRKFHRAHKSNLLRKDFQFYSPKFGDVPNDLPYEWPIVKTSCKEQKS